MIDRSRAQPPVIGEEPRPRRKRRILNEREAQEQFGVTLTGDTALEVEEDERGKLTGRILPAREPFEAQPGGFGPAAFEPFEAPPFTGPSRGRVEAQRAFKEQQVFLEESRDAIERLYPDLVQTRGFVTRGVAGEPGVTEEEIGFAAIENLQARMEEDPEAFLDDLKGQGRTPDTELVLQALFGASPQDIEAFFGADTETLAELSVVAWPSLTPEAVQNLMEEDPDAFIDVLLRIGGKTDEKEAFLRGLGMDNEAIDEIFSVWHTAQPIDGKLTAMTINMRTGKAFDQQGNLVGSYNQITREFSALPVESEAKDIWDAVVLSAAGVWDRTAGFFLDVVPTLMYPEVSEFHRKLRGDAWADQVNERNQEIRDGFRAKYGEQRRKYEAWVEKHPELTPSRRWEEGAYRHPSLLKEASYFAYEAANIAPYLVASAVTAVAVTAATGNPLAGIIASGAILVPSETEAVKRELLLHGMEESQAAQVALAAGALIGFLEGLGHFPLFKSLSPLLMRKFRAEAGKELARLTMGQLTKKGLRTFALVEITETLTEVLQEAVSNAAIKIADEEHSLFEGFEDIAVKTAVAVAPLALVGSGASMVRVAPSRVSGLSDAEMEAKGWLQDVETGNWYEPAANIPEGKGLERPLEMPGGIRVTPVEEVSVVEKVAEPIEHRGTEPEGIAIADELGVRFEGIQPGFQEIPSKLMFTDVRQTGSTFTANTLEEARTKLAAMRKAFAKARAKPAPRAEPVIRTDLLPADWSIVRVESVFGRPLAEADFSDNTIRVTSERVERNPVAINHEIAHVVIEPNLKADKFEAFNEGYIKASDWPTPVKDFGRFHEQLADDLGAYIGGEQVTPKIRAFFQRFFPEIKPPAPIRPAAPRAEPAAPETFSIEEFAPVEPPLPDQTLPSEAVPDIPHIKDIGIIERVRPTRKVFEKMGLGEEIWKPAFKAEVELNEAREAFRKRLKEVAGWVGKDKERRALVFRELENPGSQPGLTFNEKRAVTWFRDFFNEWADTLDLAPGKRLTNYVTHIFEADITEQLKADQPLDPAIARMLEYKAPKTIFNPFLQERLGATSGLIEDPLKAAEAYSSRQLRVFYYEPLLQKLRLYADAAPGASSRYLQEFAQRLTGRPLKIDEEVNNTVKQLADAIDKIPGGSILANRLRGGNPSGMASYNFTSALYTLWLGFKPTSAIRNLSQHSLILAETGPAHFADGIRLRFTKEGKAAMNDSLVLRSRRAAFVPGIDDSFARGWTDKFREAALFMFRQADKQNVSDAFLSGYSEAKSLIPGADRQVWIERGDEVAADTQYLYTKLNSFAMSQSSIGRVFSMLTTWSENWLELMVKFLKANPSKVYTAYEKTTGTKIQKKNWSNTRKSILMYMLIVGLGFVLKDRTRLKALEYTGLTSIRYIADIMGGDFPALEYPGAVADIVAGVITDDERRLKTGLARLNPKNLAGIVRQVDAVASGDRDWLTLLLYLKGQDWEVKVLRDKWAPGFKDYEKQTTPKERSDYRKFNPKVEARMFVVNRLTTLSTEAAREEALRLIEEHGIDTDLVKGYNKVFGEIADQAIGNLDHIQGRLGTFEVGELGGRPEEHEIGYFQMNDYATEVNKVVQQIGRTKLEQDGDALTRFYLEAKDLWVGYDDLSDAASRRLYRQQFPELEASLYLFGKIATFENPKSAVALLKLMEKFGIPPEAVRAFTDKPEKYDELFTPLWNLRLKWDETLDQYAALSQEFEDDELRDEQEKWLTDNPDARMARREIEALNLGATEKVADLFVDYNEEAFKYSPNSPEAKLSRIDNPPLNEWGMNPKTMGWEDLEDENISLLRLNKEWRVQDEAYDAIKDNDASKQAKDRADWLALPENEKYARARREIEFHEIDLEPDDERQGLLDSFVDYKMEAQKGFRGERHLKEDRDLYQLLLDEGLITKAIAFEDIPDEQYDDLYDDFPEAFDRYYDEGGITLDVKLLTGKARIDKVAELRQDLFDENPGFERGRLEREGWKHFTGEFTEWATEEWVGKYADYYGLPAKGMDQELYLKNNPGLAAALDLEKITKHVESLRISVKYAEQDALRESYGDPESPDYIPNETKRGEKREDMFRDDRDYAVAWYQRFAYDKKFPDELVGRFAEFRMVEFDRPEGWTKYWADDRYLLSHPQMFATAKKLLKWDRKMPDRSKVATQRFERAWNEEYDKLRLANGKADSSARKAFRRRNPWFNTEGMKVLGWKPLTAAGRGRFSGLSGRFAR